MTRERQSDPAPRVQLRMLGEEAQDWDRLAVWFQNPHVREFYREEPSIVQIRAKFGPRTQPNSRVRPRIILDERIPVGYAQFYPLTDQEVTAYQLPSTIGWGGFDLLIGDRSYWNQGIGTAVIQHLFAEITALGLSHVAIDTAYDNLRAIGLYRKMGFERGRLLEKWEEEKTHVLMTRALG